MSEILQARAFTSPNEPNSHLMKTGLEPTQREIIIPPTNREESTTSKPSPSVSNLQIPLHVRIPQVQVPCLQNEGCVRCLPKKNNFLVSRSVALPEQSYYKRVLPPSCIAFNSKKGKELFRGALDEEYMESYFALSQQFLTQSEPAYCGLSTLCMILNALEIDPMRQWKGPWRWYDESMLDCCRPLEQVKQDGITLGEFACLARCNGLSVKTFRPQDVAKERFIADIKRTSRSPTEFMAVSFFRGTLQQTGVGHFSPIGGYNEKENMILIMDVARFKYPPYWVSVDLMWEALFPIDTTTNKSRGYITAYKGSKPYTSSALSQLALNKASWPRLAAALFKDLPTEFRKLPSDAPVEQVIKLVIDHIPEEYDSVVESRMTLFVQNVPFGNASASPSEYENEMTMYVQGLDDLLHKVYALPLYHLVKSAVASHCKADGVIAVKNSMSSMSSIPMNRPTSAYLYSPSASSSLPGSPHLKSNPVSPYIPNQNWNDAIASSFHIGNTASNNSLHTTDMSSPYLPTTNQSFRRTASIASLHPPSHPVNDFNAFLTMFVLALLTYQTPTSIQRKLTTSTSSKSFSPSSSLSSIPSQSSSTSLSNTTTNNTNSSSSTSTSSLNGNTVIRNPSLAHQLPEEIKGEVIELLDINDDMINQEISFLKGQMDALTELTRDE